MSTQVMVICNQKEFEASQCFGPIQSRPHEAVLWPVIVQSKKRAKNHLELKSQNVMILNHG